MPNDSPNKVWQRSLTTLSALALLVTVVTALYWARSVFIPVTMAIFLAFVLTPLVVWLRRLGLGKAPTVFAAVTLAGAMVFVTLGIVAWQGSALVERLPDHTEEIKGKIAAVKEWLGMSGKSRFSEMFHDISEVFGGQKNPPPGAPIPGEAPQVTVRSPTESPAEAWWKGVMDYLGPMAEYLGQAAFALVLTVFILWKKDDLRNRFLRLIGDTRLTTATKAVDDASRRISRYLLMQLIINASFGLLITVSMLLIQVPYALLWGVVAGLMRYIPYLGTWLGLIPALLVTFALTNSWWQPVTVLVVYGTAELLCGNIF